MKFPRLVVVTASLATVTAIGLSILASWQRGGVLVEKCVWVAVSIVLTLGAHLLPALVRNAGRYQRLIAGVLWVACMPTACYGHITFFLMAQQHAGQTRAQSVSTATISPRRSLTTVEAERAVVVGELSSAQAQRCIAPCRTRDARIESLAARQRALEVESGDVRRQQQKADRIEHLQDAALTDPVTALLGVVTGISAGTVNLLTALVFATVVECLGSFLWWTAIQPSLAKQGSTDSVAHEELPVSAVPPPVGDLERLSHAVASGQVRPTVAEIRRYLRCSQAKAASLRQQLVSTHS